MKQFYTIIGMPSSGKTTFLAALWHLITSGELDPSLTLERLEGDYYYLNLSRYGRNVSACHGLLWQTIMR